MDDSTFMFFVKMALRDQVPYTFQEDVATVSPVSIIDENTKNIVKSGFRYHFSIHVSSLYGLD